MENNLNNKQGWALRDVIMMALLGLVFAAVYLAVFNLGMALAAALTTTGLGDFAFDIIYGVWFMAGTLGAYIIRKKGAVTTLAERRMLATRAFGVTSHYDTAIHGWFDKSQAE